MEAIALPQCCCVLPGDALPIVFCDSGSEAGEIEEMVFYYFIMYSTKTEPWREERGSWVDIVGGPGIQAQTTRTLISHRDSLLSIHLRTNQSGP